MDKAGNIGLGYSVSSNTVYPSLGYTTRLASDPPGTMRAESILHAGNRSQSFNDVRRWGDYSNLSVDPTDDCTFWFTSEYYDSSSTYWKTRIGTFSIPGCEGSGPPQIAHKMVLTLLTKVTGAPLPTATPTQPGPTPTATPTQPSGGTIVNGGFESGGGVGWSETSTGGFDLIVNRNSTNPTLPVHGGEWLAWLGGAHNETAELSQVVTVPASAPHLAFWMLLYSEEIGCTWDTVDIMVNSTTVGSLGMCEANNTGSYVRGSVNLSAYAGQTVTIKFHMETDFSNLSNFFLDDVAFATSAAEEGSEGIPVPDAGWRRK